MSVARAPHGFEVSPNKADLVPVFWRGRSRHDDAHHGMPFGRGIAPVEYRGTEHVAHFADATVRAVSSKSRLAGNEVQVEIHYLHLHECIPHRGCRAEQPSPAGAWARKPANSSQLCAKAQRRDRRTRSMFLEHVLCRRPLRAPWGPAFEHQNRRGSSSPAMIGARLCLPPHGRAPHPLPPEQRRRRAAATPGGVVGRETDARDGER